MTTHRMKSFFWFCLCRGIQPSLAGRRSTFSEVETSGSPSFMKLGGFPLTGDAIWGSAKSQSQQDAVNVHGLDLPSSFPLEDFDEVRPMSTRVVPRPSKSSVTRRGLLRKSSKTKQAAEVEETPASKTTSTTLSVSVSSPLIPSEDFELMTGDEFSDPAIVDRLAHAGYDMCTQEGNDNAWIDFQPHKDTEKLLKSKDMMTALEEDEVLVYIGKARSEGSFGSHLPIIKTKSILPISAQEMAELLMDSSRVKIYNKMSMGRKDIRILGEHTKVVCNLTKPPVAKSQMVSVTLMHSQSLQEEGPSSSPPLDSTKQGYLVVSRAVPGLVDEDLAELPRNDILLGVNLLEDIGPDQCLMTAVTHVYSPALPTMLARGMGVSSAINFVKDIRKACVPVAAN